jgi:hypothetical protein
MKEIMHLPKPEWITVQVSESSHTHQSVGGKPCARRKQWFVVSVFYST